LIMVHWFFDISFALYLAVSAGLVFYGLNGYVLLGLFARRARETLSRQKTVEEAWNHAHPPGAAADLPVITTQIPLYNEFNVAERVIRAVAALDYPKHLHQIQVLDDSTDETRELVDRIAEEIRATGVWIDVLRRDVRQGYKAGALAAAMPAAQGELIAIFDSDFVPAADFLRSLLPHLGDPQTGLAQARWGHLNREHSLLTRAQSVGIDGHFAIEQTARSGNHLFLNFNGTAGIWRRRAIEDAGGWAADTLTEDLDLSYRAQLRGWLLEYVSHVVVPAELPDTYAAFKAQQFRWAKGSIQTAMKLLPGIFRSDRDFFAKLQSVFHLCHYCAHPLMLAVALLALPAAHHLDGARDQRWFLVSATLLLASTLGPSALYITSQYHLYPECWRRRILMLPGLMLVGFGICISNTRAVFEALLGIKSGFIRTPKRGAGVLKTYRPVANRVPLLEILAGLYCAVTALVHGWSGNYAILPFLTLYVVGFSLVGWSSLREQLQTKPRV